MNVLTSLQEDFLKVFSKTPLKDSFFLTCGTALLASYLQHRLSEDMNLFTKEKGRIPQASPIIQDISLELGGKLEIKRSFRNYIEFF